MSARFPLSIKSVSPDVNKQLLEDFTGERTGFVQVGDDEWFFPSKYASQGANFYNFKVRKDDTWVVTFPRSGTTWTQELVWLIANDLDYDTATKIPLVDRFPFLEFSLFVHDDVKQELLNQSEGDPEKQALIEQLSKPGYEVLNEITSPRFIKTHFPFSLLPPNLLEEGCKVIYVARNPKDVAVSFYHLNRLFRTQGYKGDFKKYWDYFEKSLHPWTPYWTHVIEGWKRREHPNMLFLFYEEMNKDISATVEKVADFLGKSLTDEQLSQLTSYLHINNFRKNKAVNMDPLKAIGLLQNGEQDFIRKGQNGSWTDEFTPELEKRADEWIKENMKKTDLRFPVHLVEE